jgi:hypothetical protein
MTTILVKWGHWLDGEHYEEGIGIIIGYVPYPDGTKCIIAPLDGVQPVEVPLRHIHFVVGPDRGKNKIRKALKELRENADQKPQ